MNSPRPVPNDVPPVTVNDLRECIGSLVILWSSVESELRRNVTALDPLAEPAYGKTVIGQWATLAGTRLTDPAHRAVLHRFLGRIESARQVRNAICHGFDGYSADPFGRGQPTELHVRIDGNRVTIPYAAVQRILHDLATTGHFLACLTSVANDPTKPRNADAVAEVNAHLDRLVEDYPAPTCAFLHP